METKAGSLQGPRFLCLLFLQILFLFWENWEKAFLESNETYYFAKMERFHLCLSIRIISISKVGCDFEMKIQTIPSPKAKVGCFDRPFFFFTSRAFLPEINKFLQQALHLTSSSFSPAKHPLKSSSVGGQATEKLQRDGSLVEVPLPLDTVYSILSAYSSKMFSGNPHTCLSLALNT